MALNGTSIYRHSTGLKIESLSLKIKEIRLDKEVRPGPLKANSCLYYT